HPRDPCAGAVLLVRRLEALAFRRRPHVRARGDPVLHTRQGRHAALARPGEEHGRSRVPAHAVNERWDGDRIGGGVSDGEAFAPPLRTLLDEMARPDWNTEH